MNEFKQRAQELIEAGHHLFQLGLVPATSGNFSARLSDGTVAITVSGSHKGRLVEEDIMLVDMEGNSLDERRPSAETLLHLQIYKRYEYANVILHPHSVNATLLSRLCDESVILQDYELLKAFPDIDTHSCQVLVPIFDNDQNIARLAQVVDTYLLDREPAHGYLIRGHGFYAWGESMEDAMRHVEAFEFLFECEIRLKELAR